MTSFPKSRPRALDREDRTKDEAALYRKNSAKARLRDGNACRICGATWRLQTHHVERRSHYGTKRVYEKHHVTNLLTVCGGPDSCHELFNSHVLKAVSTTTKGTAGPVLVTRWSDATNDHVPFKEQA